MNRFIKKNIFLVGTLAISALCVLFLLVLAVMQYFEMSASIEKTNELRDRNAMLMRQQPPAVPENIKLIEKNIIGYSKAEAALKIYFGQPLYPALKSFCEVLKINPEELRKEFKKFYDEKGFNIDSNRQQVCRDFRDSQNGTAKPLWNREKWEEAMEQFIKAAEKTTEEKLSDHNYEEIFLSCLGLPRNMGGSDDSMRVFRSDMQKRIGEIFKTKGKEIDTLGINFFTKRPVEQIKDNKAFNDKKDRIAADKSNTRAAENTTNSSEAVSGINKADEIRHWEIICDLTHHLCKAQISTIEEISYCDLAGKNVNSCNYYTYTLVVTGSEKSVRNLLNSLTDAYKEHRVYVVRNLSIAKQEDQVQDIIDVANKRIGVSVAEEKTTLSTSNKKNPDFGGSDSEEKKIVVAEEYFKEEGKYSERVAGRSNIVTAAVTFDYVVYNIDVTK